MPKPVGEQVIVVVGASSGIGLATALEAGRRGARVVLAARGVAALEEAATEIRAKGGDAIAVPADVTDYPQVEALAARAAGVYGRIDSWIGAAGVLTLAPFREQPLADFRQVMEINLMGQVHGAKAALPYLEETDGALICLGSAFSDHGAPMWSSYCASKHAIKGWIESLRAELKHEGSGVRVTLVKPSTVNTPLFDRAKTQMGVKPLGLPPYYSPEMAAREILQAAEGNVRDVYIGDTARLANWAERFSPRLLDMVLTSVGVAGSRSSQPKAPGDVHNLYAPVEGRARLRSSFLRGELPVSPYQTIENHPFLASVALAAVGGLLANRTRRGRKRPHLRLR